MSNRVYDIYFVLNADEMRKTGKANIPLGRCCLQRGKAMVALAYKERAAFMRGDKPSGTYYFYVGAHNIEAKPISGIGPKYHYRPGHNIWQSENSTRKRIT